MPTKTYDPGLVVVTFLGNILTGVAEGTFINAQRNEDVFSTNVGSDGEVARIRNRNRTGQVSLTLQQSSSSNDILTAIQKQDELLGVGIGPLFIKDLRGTTLVSATNAWITRPANVEFAKELSTREWVFGCEALNLTVGGNF